jgi:adenylate cyclase
MGIEIERKYLVEGNSYKYEKNGFLYVQGYLFSDSEKVVRVRTVDTKGFITIKSKVIGFSRDEYEYEIPVKDAMEMLHKLCEKPLIEKHRYIYEYLGNKWEIDEFHGENEGLVIAEIELDSEKAEFLKPEWVGEEVTGIEKYYNSHLVKYPYRKWD